MGNLSLHANSASEEFDCKPCLYRPGCTGICIEKENTFKVMPLEDDILSASQNVGLMVQELGVALNQILHTHTTCEPIDCNISTNDDTVLPLKEMQSCVAANLSTDTIKDETNSCLEVVQPSSLAMTAKDDISCMFVHDSILKAENPNDEGPTPLPAPPKPPSAMKGSRAQQGTPLKAAKLSVKWSPDVYDPPVTSDSHTVKGHRQRPRAKKDQHKSRYNKSKSSRGSSSSGDKKHVHGRSTSSSVDSRLLRLRAYRDGTSIVDVDYVVSCQELKFGSSCYVESLPQVHLSVAEAS